MKIFVLFVRENWIIDKLASEWISHNKKLHTNNIYEADVIWVLSQYAINASNYNIFKQKKVITTIHHITPWKINERHFQVLNEVTDVFHVFSDKTFNTLKKYSTKPIKTIPLWHNENMWTEIKNKQVLRDKHKFAQNDFLVGSFQRDTEGASIRTGTFEPKLEKGPDIFVKCVKLLKEKKHANLKVILTGTRRHYIINELEKNNIEYYYFEMCDVSMLNELYNCLDLYIVGSRVEGGPRAINECSLNKIPIMSTDVGIANLLCEPNSIFDMNNVESILNCKTNVEYNYEKAQKYTIKNYMEEFTKRLTKII